MWINLDREWCRCQSWLEAARAASHDAMTLDEMLEAVKDGTMHFWPALDSAMVTELSNKGQDLHIRLFGGTMARLREMLPAVEAFGRDVLGCQAITVLGRPGWARTALAHERQYHPVATLLRKELSHVLRIEADHHSELVSIDQH